MSLSESVVVRGRSGITDPLKSLLQSEWEKRQKMNRSWFREQNGGGTEVQEVRDNVIK
jgi:hypothetical protein